MSGLIEKGIVGQIRRELQNKFQGRASPDLLNRVEPSLPPQGWVGYAYLFQSLPFAYAFKRLEEPLAFGSSKVASFGLRKATCRLDDVHRAEQVVVSDYKTPDDFVLEIKPKDESERIVLAKVAPAETLEKTIEVVQTRIASADDGKRGHGLGMGESIVVPVLNFDLLQSYDDLCNKPLTNPGPMHGIPIILACQEVRFRLDEYGAILKSEATMVKSACGPGGPREFVFDKPFLILMERKGAARPYLALWVDNPELLVPFE